MFDIGINGAFNRRLSASHTHGHEQRNLVVEQSDEQRAGKSS